MQEFSNGRLNHIGCCRDLQSHRLHSVNNRPPGFQHNTRTPIVNLRKTFEQIRKNSKGPGSAGENATIERHLPNAPPHNVEQINESILLKSHEFNSLNEIERNMVPPEATNLNSGLLLPQGSECSYSQGHQTDLGLYFSSASLRKDQTDENSLNRPRIQAKYLDFTNCPNKKFQSNDSYNSGYTECQCASCEARNRSVFVIVRPRPRSDTVMDLMSHLKRSMNEWVMPSGGRVEDVIPAAPVPSGSFFVRQVSSCSSGTILALTWFP